MPEDEPDDRSAENATELAGQQVAIGWMQQRVGAVTRFGEDVLERMRGRPLPDIGLDLYERDRASAGSVIGSALALRLFLFFMPLLVLAVGLLGFVRSWFSTSDVQDTVQLSGVIGSQLDSALQQPNASRWTAVVVGFFGVLLTGRTLTKVLVAASCLAWRMPVQTKVPIRLIGSLIGLMTAVGFVTLIVNRVRDAAGIGLASLSLGAAFLIYTAIWIVLCLPLPRVTPDPGSLFPGAALIALTMVGMQAVSQLYLPHEFSQASELYGAIGTTIVTLGWFFILGRGIMLALSLNAAMYERVGSITGAVFSLPILRLLPRHFGPLRRMLAEEYPDPRRSDDDVSP